MADRELKWNERLGRGMMAFGDGLTGRNTYGNYMDAYSKAEETSAKIAYERQKQQEVTAQQAFENQLAVSKFALDQKKAEMFSTGQPVFTIGEEGLVPVGSVPKGSKVIPPASMLTGQQKADIQVNTAAKKDTAVRDKKLGGLMQAVDYFDKKINEIPVGTGVTGRLQGVGKQVEGWLQTDPKAAAYMASLQGMRSQIARGLGEVGNLSEYEQKYAVKLLPNLSDNAETRKQKLINFRDYINQKLGSTTKSSTVYTKTGTNSKGQRVGMKEDGTIEVIK